MKKLIFLLILTLTLIISGCSASKSEPTAVSKVPSGKDCAENVAYLQAGVDKYKQALGDYPITVENLLESKDGKGPFTEIIPKCPSGNKYIIKNGTIMEL